MSVRRTTTRPRPLASPPGISMTAESPPMSGQTTGRRSGSPGWTDPSRAVMAAGNRPQSADSKSALPRGGGIALLEHPAPRQDGPHTGQGGQGQDTTSGQSSTGIRGQRRQGRHVEDLSTHWEHVPDTLYAAIHLTRWETTRIFSTRHGTSWGVGRLHQLPGRMLRRPGPRGCGRSPPWPHAPASPAHRHQS